MKKIGIFYSFRSHKTKQQVRKMIKHLGEKNAEEVDVEKAAHKDFDKFDNYIFAVPTWFDGELPNYWDEFIPEIEDMDLKGKKIAIFGLGDQKNYPQNFADSIGIMAEVFEYQGAEIVGYTSAEGYDFEESRAYHQGQFKGLAIDNSNQGALTNERVVKWAEHLKEVFN